MFYTALNDLPVIAPSCFSAHGRNIWMPWSWATADRLPFDQLVLCPVDLKCGWDLRLSGHQQPLRAVGTSFAPTVTTSEPRCKYWGIMGSSRDPE
eukprot:9274847-Pyramimonas_sp.AAC.1